MNLSWTLLGLVCAVLFFCAVMLVALSLRMRRGRALAGAALMLALSYIVLQCVAIRFAGYALPPGQAAFTAFFLAGNGLFPAALCVGMAAGEALLFARLRHTSDRITSSSIKEAVDTLPSGICFYREDGRVILVNRAMENLCRRLTGEALVNGRGFFEAVRTGALPQDFQLETAGEEPLIVLPEGTAWSFSCRRLQDERLRANMLVASDVTEIYEKNRALHRAQGKVTALNRRLTDYNREIVALTTAREILDAKVKIHDELGGNLLAIRRYLLGDGTDQDRADIVERLQTNVAFLKSGRAPEARDECALMLETAQALGVRVEIIGTLPEREPARHILAVAINECFTNTLRHARGTSLAVRVTEDGRWIHAEFTNDGEQPQGPIRERGGLSSLRTLTERAGGRMVIHTTPAFSITLTLPKEDDYGLPSDDRG